MTRVLVIDNYDSFTYNLVQYLGVLGVEPTTVRNDAMTTDDIRAAAPDAILLSPGPGRPEDAGVSMGVLEELQGTAPIFGVCLGMQCLGEVHGASVVRAPEVMHGKTSLIHHDERGVFSGMPNPFEATRYHSLVVEASTVPDCLEVTARTADGLVMGLRHRDHATEAVQFHPESILTADGIRLLANFLGVGVPDAVGVGGHVPTD